MVAHRSRRHGHGAEAQQAAQLPAAPSAPVRPKRGVGPCPATPTSLQIARGASLTQSLDMAAEFIDPDRDLVAKRCRDGVLAMSATGDRHLRPALSQDPPLATKPVADQPEEYLMRLSQHQEVAGLCDVLRRGTPVHPTAMRARLLREPSSQTNAEQLCGRYGRSLRRFLPPIKLVQMSSVGNRRCRGSGGNDFQSPPWARASASFNVQAKPASDFPVDTVREFRDQPPAWLWAISRSSLFPNRFLGPELPGRSQMRQARRVRVNAIRLNVRRVAATGRCSVCSNQAPMAWAIDKRQHFSDQRISQPKRTRVGFQALWAKTARLG